MTAAATELTWAAVEAVVQAIQPADVEAARWYGGKGRPIDRLAPVEAFDLGDGTGLAIIEAVEPGAKRGARYTLPLGDGAFGALAVAIAAGRTIPAVERPRPAAAAGSVTAALVCRPASGLRALAPGGAADVAGLDERPLDADQSNTSRVLGDRLLLKLYRRLEIGLNPDLELNAFLSEEMAFDAVPPLAGYAEVVSREGAATVALLQAFLPDAADAYEATADQLAAWMLGPGGVTVESATEIAAAMGLLTASLHAALAGSDVPEFAPREATREELRAWRRAAQLQLQRAIDAVDGEPGAELREMAPVIAEQLTVIEAVARVPIVIRVHADLHLGQVLLTDDGPRIVDFEGEPTRSIEERRRATSPLRDAASMLRSIDHAGRSARRRAERMNGRPLTRSGLDIDAWLVRARERFVESYREGLRAAGAPIDVDEDLLRAFEFEKESYEFVYAATWLPDWLWAPLEGMRALVAEVRAQ